ncbi:MAG: hypothetical protein R3E66_01300 [bacterium]
MSEWVYPIAAVALLYFAVIPSLTLIAYGLLRRAAASHISGHAWGASWVWLAIVSPTLLGLTWWTVDALHQIDGHHALEACMTPHAEGGCAEAVWLSALVLLPLVWWFGRTHKRSARLGRMHFDTPLLRHVRVYEVHDAGAPVSARGLFRTWVAVRHDAVDTLSSAQLHMALLHEAEHVRAFDPLRRWLAVGALALNPVGFLLRPFLARWELGRELQCDLAAAVQGDRFDLAEAILRIARLSSKPHLCEIGLVSTLETMQLRIAVLIHDTLPTIQPTYNHRILAALLTFALAAQVPVHHLLDVTHRLSEQVLHWVLS